MTDTGFILGNRSYNVVKFIVTIFLPALGSLYFGMAQIWGLPYGEEVVGSVAVIATFFGVVLGISKRSYDKSSLKYDGALVVDQSNPEKDLYSFEVLRPLSSLTSRKEVLLKVKTPE